MLRYGATRHVSTDALLPTGVPEMIQKYISFLLILIILIKKSKAGGWEGVKGGGA